jgi:Protein of unknown function (DUF4239)
MRQETEPMSPILIGLIVLSCTFCGALAGIALHRKLPAQHKAADSRDVVKLVLGLIATIAALVMSLLIATAHTSYVTQESEVQTLGIHIVQLDRVFAGYGPDAGEARTMFRQLVAARLEQAWPNRGDTKPSLEASRATREQNEQLIERVISLQASSDSQQFAKSRALQLLTEIGDERQLLLEQSSSSIPWPFLVVLVFWLVVLFVGFGFLCRSNGTVLVALFVGSLSVAGAIFLVLDMNQPFSGLMHISNAPIRIALETIAQ